MLNSLSITSDKQIKLFVRVKERIIPQKSTYKLTSKFLEILLYKDNPNHTKWNRLEPNEYTEVRPTIQQSTINDTNKG